MSGVSDAKAYTYNPKSIRKALAGLPIMRLSYVNKDRERFQVISQKDLYPIFAKLFEHNIQLQESMWVVLLNAACVVNGCVKISEGSTQATVLDTGFIMASAILSNSKRCIIVHNHPSGNMRFSKNDIEIKNLIKQSLRMIDVELLDFCICGIDNGQFKILADNG